MRGIFLAGLFCMPALAFAEGLVTLTSIPVLSDAAKAGDLSEFLNRLYLICIGVAVVLAVLQLIRAGITYMTAAGSVGSTEEAKHLISTSLLGLLLVLSPYLVFSIINPAILKLDINTSNLQTQSVHQVDEGTQTNTNSDSTFSPGSSTLISESQVSACSSQGCSVTDSEEGKYCTCAAGTSAPGTYKWKGVLTCTSAGNPPTNKPAQGGPFSTQAACYADYNRESNCAPSPSQFTCSCDTPASEQGGCN